MVKKIQNYINGKLVDPINKEWIDNYEPATGKVYSRIPDSTQEDVNVAVEAAEAAFDQWSTTPAKERSKIMQRIADLIEQHLDELALAESIDNGKPVSLAKKVDIPRARDNFSFFATAILHFFSESHRMEESSLNYTLREPIGVVGCISPWNLPLYLFTWKIAPAIAAGNCVIAKPSEITPMTAYLLSNLCIEAGLPNGVLNIIHGLGAKVGAAITVHPEIKAISFTGGTRTGRDIAQKAAPMFKKLSLELGGKNPNIIFEDCDFDQMMSTTVRSSFANQGQICLCGSRIFIEESLYAKFKEAFVQQVSALKVGDPNEDNNLGAIVSETHRDKILYYINLAQEEGGKILTGGTALKLPGRCKDGWFIEPTVIEGLTYDCRTNQEEIFGPVVTITPFKTQEEVLKYANSTEYGLSASVWTRNLDTSMAIADQLEAGIVWINCWLVRDLRTPFGGMKNSGVGREGGFDALRFFTEPKNICIKWK